MLRPLTSTRGRQRGLSVVEMMVGVAIGLIVVAAATIMVTGQLGENRRLLLETQIEQDLRATADIITRELRRAGTLNYPDAVLGIWASEPTYSNAVSCNKWSPITLNGSSTVSFRYYRGISSQGPFGYTLSNGVIRTAIPKGSLVGTCAVPVDPTTATLQDLTDSKTVVIEKFEVIDNPTSPAVSRPPLRMPCPKLCIDGTQACWPTLTVRELQVLIVGRSVSDPSVLRSVRSTVRVRNDLVTFNDDLVNPTQYCPS